MIYDQIDRLRRTRGRWLDMAGLAPIETPCRVVFAARPLTLKAYTEADAPGPVLLIVPAPIKRAYLWDLAPGVSVIRHCLRRGIRPYLIQWERPGADEQDAGLAEYAAEYLLACQEAIAAETGAQTTFVAGHSLGGVLAAIYAALYPERLRGLVLLSAPLRFGPGTGAFAPVVARAPRAGSLTALMPENVPGSFLNTVSILTAPATFEGERLTDWWRSLADPEALNIHAYPARVSRAVSFGGEERRYPCAVVRGRCRGGAATPGHAGGAPRPPGGVARHPGLDAHLIMAGLWGHPGSPPASNPRQGHNLPLSGHNTRITTTSTIASTATTPTVSGSAPGTRRRRDPPRPR